MELYFLFGAFWHKNGDCYVGSGLYVSFKAGEKEYHACVNKGAYPYLPVLENLVSDDEIDSEVSLSVDQIPLKACCRNM